MSESRLSVRERAKRRRKWRKARVREAAGHNSKWILSVLYISISLESLYFLKQYYQEQNLNFHVFHVEEAYHAEWSQEDDPISERKFGIRWNPKTLELEFYHQTQEREY